MSTKACQVTTWELRHGSCLDPVTGLASLEDKSVDVVIADPPYEAEAHTKGRRTLNGRHRAAAGVRTAPLPFAPITEQERLYAATEMARVVRRWTLVFCQVEAAHKWWKALGAAGLQYIRTMIWFKPDGQPQLTGDRPGVGYESIVLAHPRGKKRWNGGGKTGVFSHSKGYYPSGVNGQASKPHPTTKPQALMRELVSLFSDPGELVCDPYAGSGSTGVACLALGRRFLGWELDAEYTEIARRRLSGQGTIVTPGQLDMFGDATNRHRS